MLKNRSTMPHNFREIHRKDPFGPADEGEDGGGNRMKLDRSWILHAIGERHRTNGRTDAGVPIEISYVSDAVIANVDVFYICDGCGRCYWDGSHLENILAGKLADLLSLKYD